MLMTTTNRYRVNIDRGATKPVRRWSARVVSAIAVVGLLLGSGSAAMAETPQEGLWYFDVFHIQDAHDAGITGKGVTIAVLDSQINLDLPTLKGTNIEVQPSKCFDESGVLIPPTSTSLDADHGTNVTSLIVGTGAGYAGQTGVKGVAPGAKVLYFMTGPPSADGNIFECRGEGGAKYSGDIVADYVDSAVALGAQIISVSLGVSPVPELVDAVANAQHNGVVIVGSLANELLTGDFITATWPATANGAVAVQRVDSDGNVKMDVAGGQTEQDPNVVVAGPGGGILVQGFAADGSWETQRLANGTSYATPVVSSFLALVKQKYPKATGNQLIQTLINNTGVVDHPLGYSATSGIGFGIASATHMLKVDPTQYPDVNPLVQENSLWGPSAEMIANGTNASTPTPSATKPPEADRSMSWLVPVVIGGVIFLLLIIGVIILVVVLASRRIKRP